MRAPARLLVVTIFALVACGPPAATRCPEPEPAPTPVASEAAPAARSTSAVEVAAEVVAWINAGDAEAMFARFSDAMKAAAPLARLGPMLESIVAERGRLTGATPIEATDRAGTFQVAAERGAWKLQLAVDAQGTITGLGITEPDATAPAVARSAPVGLPVRGEWLVFWGGDRPELNHHLDHPSQRRAADLLMVDADGVSHRGDGRALTDYYAYGQDILAMADGVVITAIDGVPDNVPGELNPYVAPGNLVIVRHEGDMHSAYAHLVPGSLKVKVGDRVRRGQVLGACGNSGNSSEPHLHVQLQDGPRFEKSWGVEPVFADVVVVRDGASERRSDYTFLKGDRVSAPASPAARAKKKPQ